MALVAFAIGRFATPKPPPPVIPPADLVVAQHPLVMAQQPTPAPLVDPCATREQPGTGLYQIYDNRLPFVAPLTITVPPDAKYFVLLVDVASHEPVESFFIWGGGAVYGKAPLGTYVLTYATGRFWCGADQLFGPNTDTGEPMKSLTFTESDTAFDGHTVSLVPQLNGNLDTRPIPRDQFWHG